MWRYETREVYEREKSRAEEEARIASLDPKDKLDILYEMDNWTIKVNTFKQNNNSRRGNSKFLIAISNIISESDGLYLKSIRDLNTDHVNALMELDKLYPDSEWIKHVQYPPIIWRLRVHIEERRNSGSFPIPLRNSYLLADVIKMVQTRECEDLLVWVPLVAERA
jgi:hypothetical protein